MKTLTAKLGRFGCVEVEMPVDGRSHIHVATAGRPVSRSLES